MNSLQFRTSGPLKAFALGAMLLLATTGAGLAAPTENIRIAATFWDLVTAGKTAKAMTYVDPQAEFISGDEVSSGTAQIRQAIDGYAAKGYQFHPTHFSDDGKGRITYWYEVYEKDGTTVVTYGYDGLTIVKAGHIVFDGTTTDVPARFASP